MILLLALPVVAMVGLAHRYLLLYAPSNVLIRRARASRPTLSTIAAMMAIASGLIVAVKVVSDAVAVGAPGWLNLVVLVLAWDAIKIAFLVVLEVACASRQTVASVLAAPRRSWVARSSRSPVVTPAVPSGNNVPRIAQGGVNR